MIHLKVFRRKLEKCVGLKHSYKQLARFIKLFAIHIFFSFVKTLILIKLQQHSIYQWAVFSSYVFYKIVAGEKNWFIFEKYSEI